MVILYTTSDDISSFTKRITEVVTVAISPFFPGLASAEIVHGFKKYSSITAFAASGGVDTNYSEQLDKVSSNLSALNNVYEMQVKSVSDNMKSNEEMLTGINELMNNLHSSIDDTRKYKETMSELTNNLESLNTVYGNMLSAMNFNK